MSENTPETPAVALSLSPKRVVLEHTNGPFAGLRQILGYTERANELAPYGQGITLTPSTRRGDASMVRCFDRYVLYREVPLQADGTHYPIRVR